MSGFRILPDSGEKTSRSRATIPAFLSVSPENPTVQEYEKLMSLLLALGTLYRCRRLKSGENEVLGSYSVAVAG